MENLGTNTHHKIYFCSANLSDFYPLPSSPFFLSKIIFPVSYPESGRLFWWGWAELESKEKI